MERLGVVNHISNRNGRSSRRMVEQSNLPLEADLGTGCFLAFAFSAALASRLFCFVGVFLVVVMFKINLNNNTEIIYEPPIFISL
jgi:hypothetical protein